MHQHYSKKGGQSNFAPLIFTDMKILNVVTGRATNQPRIWGYIRIMHWEHRYLCTHHQVPCKEQSNCIYLDIKQQGHSKPPQTSSSTTQTKKMITNLGNNPCSRYSIVPEQCLQYLPNMVRWTT